MAFDEGYYSSIQFDTSNVYEAAVNSVSSAYHVKVTYSCTRWSSETANTPYNASLTVEFDIIDGAIQNRTEKSGGNAHSGWENYVFHMESI